MLYGKDGLPEGQIRLGSGFCFLSIDLAVDQDNCTSTGSELQPATSDKN